MTIQGMCEEISFVWGLFGHRVTPIQIFNYSPTGELFMIWEWYEEAKFVKKILLDQHTC